MAQAFYRKWRPMQWQEVVGQEHVVHTLQNAIRQNRIGHAYLFSGPRGTGKTTTARLLAKAVNCLAENLAERPCNKCENCVAINEGRFLDLIEIDAASNTSVDDVRALRERINFSPSKGQYKVYIIDEVHMLSNAAFNALLKTLEEPPAHAIFILATTEAHKIPATVISRCQRHDFRRIPLNFILGELKQIVAQEKIDVESEALTLIARQATGSMRDAISLLDQLASTGEAISLAVAQSVLGAATSEHVVNLVQAMAHKKVSEGLMSIHQALDSGTDPRQYARQVVDYLRSMMLIKLGNADQVEVTPETKKQLYDQAESFALPVMVNAINLFNRAAYTSQISWQPALQLELALTEVLEEHPRFNEEDEESIIHQPTGKVKPALSSVGSPSQSLSNPQTTSPKVIQPFQAKNTTSSPVKPTPMDTQNPGKSAAIKIAGEIENDDLKKILQQWLNIKAAVKITSPETAALLTSSKLVSMHNKMLLLGFASDLLKNKMENNRHIELTRQKIKEITQVDIPIVCTVVNINNKTITENLQIDRDGIVGTALSMGGKIVDQGQAKDKDGKDNLVKE
jgi:DNA polymerase-3 subunit gamma/tau